MTGLLLTAGLAHAAPTSLVVDGGRVRVTMGEVETTYSETGDVLGSRPATPATPAEPSAPRPLAVAEQGGDQAVLWPELVEVGGRLPCRLPVTTGRAPEARTRRDTGHAEDDGEAGAGPPEVSVTPSADVESPPPPADASATLTLALGSAHFSAGCSSASVGGGLVTRLLGQPYNRRRGVGQPGLR